MRLLLITVLLGSLQSAFAQAELVAPGVISDGQAFGAAVSPDGKELFFVRSYGGRDSLHLYRSERLKGQWQPPQPVFFMDRTVMQIDPAFSPDGNSLLFNAFADPAQSFDVYVVSRTAGGWSTPMRYGGEINSAASDFYATITAGQSIYFTRRTESNDIYASRFENGRYRTAVPLDSSINTPGIESNPWIAPDESYLIFFSDRPGGYGDVDLYISFRQGSRWTRPLNLGSEVNGPSGEFCPSVQGGYLYFSRTEQTDGKRTENIWRIPLKTLGLKALRRTAFAQP